MKLPVEHGRNDLQNTQLAVYQPKVFKICNVYSQ